MDWKTFLMTHKGWKDSNENTVVFSAYDLQGNKETDTLWIYLDEGLRCGGMRRKLPLFLQAVKDALLGCNKTELWNMIVKDMEGESIDVCREIDRSAD